MLLFKFEVQLNSNYVLVSSCRVPIDHLINDSNAVLVKTLLCKTNLRCIHVLRHSRPLTMKQRKQYLKKAQAAG